jgi:hypothetical protein
MLSSVSVLRGVLGDRAGADAAHAEAATIREELGLDPVEFRRAYMEYALDDFPAAIRFAREAAADLERRGDTGQRSTMLAFEAWILALMGEDDDAVRVAAEARQLTSPDDAVSQILWRTAEGVVLARRGEASAADRISLEAVTIAGDTDSLDAGTAWHSRALVLSILGRGPESSDAARQARALYEAKGWVNAVRRIEALIIE